MEINRKQVIGLIGSIILVFGVFSPILSLPVIGSIDYFQNGEGDGIFILILAVISLIFLLHKKNKILLLTGFGCFVILALTIVKVNMKISQAKADMDIELENNIFNVLTDLSLRSIHFQWGILLILAGASLLIISSIIKQES